MRPEVPYGKCHCGCGGDAPVAKYSAASLGLVRGEPRRYIMGHQNKRPPSAVDYVVEDRGYQTPCWIWARYIHPKTGYGSTGGELAHVAYFRAARGPIPEGLELDHLCKQRACVNPDHLEAVTRTENVRRATRGGNSKLTRDSARVIRQLIAAGESNGSIAARFHVDPSLISKIRHYRHWKEV